MKALSLKLIPLVLLMSAQAHSLEVISGNNADYYKLGGGSDIPLQPVSNSQDLKIGGDANANLGYSCTGFNPSVSISNYMNNMADSAQNIGSGVMSSATSAIGSFPMYILSKSNTDLYNLIENGMSDASDTFHASETSCQQALSKIKDGKSPYQNWFSVSDSQGWLKEAKRAAQGDDVDINKVKKETTKDSAKYGVPWVHHGTNSGGTVGDQVPIHVMRDVSIAGYNVLVNPQGNLDNKETSADPNTSLGRFFKTAQAAGDWGDLVLGDITISSNTSLDKTHAGIGLMNLVENCPEQANNDLTCAKTIQKNLIDIVRSSGSPSGEELASISSNQMMATPGLIAAIRMKDQADQAIAISKWAQDVAIQNVVGQALVFRRILLSGEQTKPVHNLKPATTQIDKALAQLKGDIDDILFQFQVRKQLMSNTAQTILEAKDKANSGAVSEHDTNPSPSMANGTVYKKGGPTL